MDGFLIIDKFNKDWKLLKPEDKLAKLFGFEQVYIHFTKQTYKGKIVYDVYFDLNDLPETGIRGILTYEGLNIFKC